MDTPLLFEIPVLSGRAGDAYAMATAKREHADLMYEREKLLGALFRAQKWLGYHLFEKGSDADGGRKRAKKITQWEYRIEEIEEHRADLYAQAQQLQAQTIAVTWENRGA